MTGSAVVFQSPFAPSAMAITTRFQPKGPLHMRKIKAGQTLSRSITFFLFPSGSWVAHDKFANSMIRRWAFEGQGYA